MSSYASGTSVSVERTRAQIEKLVSRYGATRFMSGWDGDIAAIGFTLESRTIRFEIPLPDKNAKEFRYTPTRKFLRTPRDAEKAWEQACRSRWRAMLLVIKAKLEAIDLGVTTVEREFLAWMVVPGDGRTIGDVVIPQLADLGGDALRLTVNGEG